MRFSGDEGRISIKAAEVIAATTRTNYDAFTKALGANDRIGLNNLYAQGRVLLLPNGTRVLVIGIHTEVFGSDLIEVRVLEGQYFGRALWIAFGTAIQ